MGVTLQVAVKKLDDSDQPVPPNSYAAELQNAAMMNSRAYKDTGMDMHCKATKQFPAVDV